MSEGKEKGTRTNVKLFNDGSLSNCSDIDLSENEGMIGRSKEIIYV